MPPEELEFLPTPYAASFGPPQRTANKRVADADEDASVSKRPRTEGTSEASTRLSVDLQAKHALRQTLPEPEPDHISGQTVTDSIGHKIPDIGGQHSQHHRESPGMDLHAAISSHPSFGQSPPPSQHAGHIPAVRPASHTAPNSYLASAGAPILVPEKRKSDDIDTSMNLGYTPAAEEIVRQAHEAALRLHTVINTSDDELCASTASAVFNGLQEIRKRWLELEAERRALAKPTADGKVFGARGRARGRCRGRGRGRGRGRARWKTTS